MSKNIFVQSTGLQPSNLAETRFEVAKSERGESIDAELSNNRGTTADLAATIHSAVFDALAPVPEGQSGASESDKILPSAAAFHDASVDPLHSRWPCLGRRDKEEVPLQSPRQRHPPSRSRRRAVSRLRCSRQDLASAPASRRARARASRRFRPRRRPAPSASARTGCSRFRLAAIC